MKIAFCVEYPIGEAGGVSVLALTLIRELAAEHEITLVSGDSPESLAAAGLGKMVRQHIRWDLLKPSPAAAQTVAQGLHAAGVELAHFHFGGNYAWSNRLPASCPVPCVAEAGIPVVTTIHMAVGLLHGYCGPQKPLWFKLALLPFAWVNRMRVLWHVRKEIAVSRQDYDRLRGWYWPFRSKFVQIYHSRLKPASAPPPPAVTREKVILAVGHFAERKGQRVLAEAFLTLAKRFPEWHLWFAGHAGVEDTFNQVKRLAEQCAPGQLQVLGQRTDTPELMQRAGIYVQPSFHEGLPLSLQEALAHGCPCVATRIPGNIELVTHEHNGLLVPPGDVPALAAALERLMTQPGLREQFGQRGPQSLATLGMTTAQMTQKHRELYASVLAAR